MTTGPKKRKPGRPTTVAAERARVKLSVWFTPSQYALLLSVKPEGYPVATWAKKVLLEFLDGLERRSAGSAGAGRRKGSGS